MQHAEEVDVAIVGSGFAGIGMAIRLKQQGMSSFVMFERASDVGGVWRDNAYPGAACDVQSHLYSLSFAPNPHWQHSYSRQPDIWAYLQGCIEQFGLRPHLRLRHTVIAARWHAETQRWQIDTDRGMWMARFLVLAAGALSDPAIPRLPGLDTFAGPAFHSASWDASVDLSGKQVAVVGTGASAIQFVPAIQPRVARLHLFQRTPAWVVPRGDRPLGWTQRRLFARFPFLQKIRRATIYAVRELMGVSFRRPAMMRVLEKQARHYLHQVVGDPALRAKLTPDYTMGCKRILISDDYLPALTRPNVEVIPAGIAEVRPQSIVDSEGVERPVDAIIFGTGFRVTDQPLMHHIYGRAGQSLADTWQGSPRAHLGTLVAGFPNLFLMQGPNTGLGHSSVILMIEAQIGLVLRALRYLRLHRLATLEPTAAAQAAFVASVNRMLAGTVWVTGGCTSWYLDATGRNSTMWPGSIGAFRRRLAHFRPGEYVFAVDYRRTAITV